MHSNSNIIVIIFALFIAFFIDIIKSKVYFIAG